MENWWPQVREGDLVGYLTADEHARLLAAMETCTAAAGEVIFQKGSPSRSLLLVEEGEVEVFDESMGQPIVLAVVGRGGVVGEVGFVDGRTRTHHVRARADCRMRRLTRERLLELLTRGETVLFAKVMISMARLLAFRFREAVEQFEPVRAFAAVLKEPIDLRDAGQGFDEIEEPLPLGDPAAEPSPQDAVKVIKQAARKARKKPGATGV